MKIDMRKIGITLWVIVLTLMTVSFAACAQNGDSNMRFDGELKESYRIIGGILPDGEEVILGGSVYVVDEKDTTFLLVTFDYPADSVEQIKIPVKQNYTSSNVSVNTLYPIPCYRKSNGVLVVDAAPKIAIHPTHMVLYMCRLEFVYVFDVPKDKLPRYQKRIPWKSND